jgi:hypothetical protein
MRLLIVVAIAAAQLGAAWAQSERDIARPGGAYSVLAAQTAEACARLCADDGLCMAWSFAAQSCELKAIVPAPVAATGVISGVSTRAPASLRAWTEPPPPSAAEPDASDILAHAGFVSAAAEDDVSALLLGGPDGDGPAALGN